MLSNSPLDSYGSVRKLALVQPAAGSRSELVSPAGSKPAFAAETAKVDVKPVAVDNAALVTAVKKLNELVAPALQTVQFSLDEHSERMVVRVVDTSTKQVLRQIPNEEVISMSKTLDKLQGLMAKQTA
jgi:flagellar protein FlaG